MLPPLNPLNDVRESPTVGPPREALQQPTAPSPSPVITPFRPPPNAARRVSMPKSPPSTCSPSRRTSYRPSAATVSPQPLPPDGGTAIETMSRIPRDFFVIETHAVHPQTQYPPNQYQSTFTSAGGWETVVFPALVPHTRQQVLCLRQTLEAMRTRNAVDTAMVLEYTETEWALHSICFHELARQIKFICREQSDLLFELHTVFDAAIVRLAGLVRQLQQQHDVDEARLASQALKQTQAQMPAESPRQDHDAGSTGPQICACGCSERVNSREPWRQRSPNQCEDTKDEAEDDDDVEWLTFQRQRRRRMREFAKDNDHDTEPSAGRLQRASIVEENTAAAKVQQAFAKYQQRKAAQRALMCEEKRDAALDIQRSYRGYRERRRTLHHRAVMFTILQRRKQVAAVELLQMNVRAYLIKKRRERKQAGPNDSVTPIDTIRPTVTLTRAASTRSTASTPSQAHNPSSSDLAPVPLAASDSLTQVLSDVSELAAAFSLLHSRRRTTRMSQSVAMAPVIDDSEAKAEEESKRPDSVTESIEASEPVSSNTITDDEKELLNATLRRAQGLVLSFQSVLNELRDKDAQVSSLTKTTSTTTLNASEDVASSPQPTPSFVEMAGSLPFFFVEDGYDNANDQIPSKVLSPGRSPTAEGSQTILSPTDDDVDSDAMPLSDALWQVAVYTPRTQCNEDILLRDLVTSRDQQKRHATLKQLIADIYNTIVGCLSELPRARFDKLVRIHASLALSFADGRRFFRPNATSANEYEPVSAFVRRLDVQQLIHDHFQCQVGLIDLVNAAIAQVERDVEQFRSVDADVQRFHDYLTRVRSREDLVFFCLCRCIARDSTSGRRQPVFHDVSVRELVDVECAMRIATRLFHAGGDDAAMIQTDAFVIEPTNEIYVRHLPSHGLKQLEILLREHIASVDNNPLVDSGIHPFRTTNASHFHAREYNTTAPRSPLRRGGCSLSVSWVFFLEVVDLLRRYRSVMRHFHAFTTWTYELFHNAYRLQRQQQLLDVNARPQGAPLLEECAFVETLRPHSLGPSDRELCNVFHNALKQRQLQCLMPQRVFVSVVLVLLRNGLVSVKRYEPLQRPAVVTAATPAASVDGTHRRQREETHWLQLALQWRLQEQLFVETVDRLSVSNGNRDRIAQLQQRRNELYDLFMQRTNLSRAETLVEWLVGRMTGGEDGDNAMDTVPETDEDETRKRGDESAAYRDDGVAHAVGSPWDDES